MILSICGLEVGAEWCKCKFTHIYKIQQTRPCLTSAQVVEDRDTDDDYAIHPTLLVLYSNALSPFLHSNNSNTCFKEQDKARSVQGCLQISVSSSLQSVNYLQDALSQWVQIWQLAGPQLRSQLLRYDVASDMITSECRPGWSQLGQGGSAVGMFTFSHSSVDLADGTKENFHR